MIVFDASTVVSAALKSDSVPERALLRAEEIDVFALSADVDGEIAGVLARPRFSRLIPRERTERVLALLRDGALWFKPTERVVDCRDPKDNKYLELALASGASIIVSSTTIFSCLIPGGVYGLCGQRIISSSHMRNSNYINQHAAAA